MLIHPARFRTMACNIPPRPYDIGPPVVTFSKQGSARSHTFRAWRKLNE